MPAQKRQAAPHFVKGRKGHTSVIDCMASALWRETDGESWPELTFEELRAVVSKMQGYHVTPSTIRSSAYQYPNLFERVKDAEDGSLRWRLTKQGRTGQLP
jgi:hypothetical protein